ncbi:hypothetical protein, partial [Roseomonas genomospecies 6]|uniref:hypothetical protein n=1 Tax=Roseomonas genomospecies 6 TaxID=214106 RepID=UPI001AD7A9D9
MTTTASLPIVSLSVRRGNGSWTLLIVKIEKGCAGGGMDRWPRVGSGWSRHRGSLEHLGQAVRDEQFRRLG